jgi:hypothetical protein
MIMNNPPANGSMANPNAEKNGTLERRIFKISTQMAEERLFIVLLLLRQHCVSIAENVPPDPDVEPKGEMAAHRR